MLIIYGQRVNNMNIKLIIFIILSLFVGYSLVDSFIIQPSTRPDYCDDCIIPISTEHAQQTSLIETGLLGVVGNKLISKKKKETS